MIYLLVYIVFFRKQLDLRLKHSVGGHEFAVLANVNVLG